MNIKKMYNASLYCIAEIDIVNKLYINKNYLTSFKLHINNVKQWLKEHELYISHFYYQHVTLKNRQHNSPNDKLEGGQLYFLF